jgi:hypothetical protein
MWQKIENDPVNAQFDGAAGKRLGTKGLAEKRPKSIMKVSWGNKQSA